ncbi:hypothetical protein A2272_06540 [Candidatus Peregrinibacteria bacterium RIFOXYA12_FULL_33_12]|nr:MAG: hypothetical protein A2272_06540 [Candidatus Peregrinibacteria bacterium RIFOXYA12_FULL_33_12]
MIQVLLNGIIVGGLYALISVGFALIFSSVRFYHLAYGSLAFFGAYITYVFRYSVGLNFFLSMILSSIIFGFVGILFWKMFYSPLQKKKTSSVSMIVASFGLLIVLQNVMSLIFGNGGKSISIHDNLSQGYEFFNLFITYNQLVILAVTIIVGILFEFMMNKMKFGMSIKAVGQNNDLAMTVGINYESVMNYVFFIATFLSVIGASLISLEIGIRPIYGFHIILKIIVACVIGGMGKVKGAIAGAMMLGIIENFGIYCFGSIWQDTIAFALLTLFLVFRPKGVFE